jgi:protein SCO1/2
MTSRELRACVARAVQTVLIVVLAATPAGWSRAEGEPRFTRTDVTIAIPEVEVIDQDGRVFSFSDVVTADKPVFVEFVFATCTTICPVLSAAFSSVQRKLGDDRDRVRLVSITIDPEHDTPEELAKYLDRYGAKSGWSFYTGNRLDIDRIMKAFDAFVADKMSHRPLTFVRSPKTGTWVRLYGFAGTADLLAELERAESGSAE